VAVPDDPMDVAARFWAQLLGFEISYDGPEPGSPLWGMQLVRRLATSPALCDEEAGALVKEYLGARWSYCFPELDEIWGEEGRPPRGEGRTHWHLD
jgi:hypothetical protein